MHFSTFGGNPLASAVGIAALEVVTEQNLSERYSYSNLVFQWILHFIPVSEIFNRLFLMNCEFLVGTGITRDRTQCRIACYSFCLHLIKM